MLLNQKFNGFDIILASQSPRRKELLAGLDIDFEVKALNTEETYPEELQKNEITEFLCKKKAESFLEWKNNTILITSDTIVWLNDKAMEKPENQRDAAMMLLQLANKTHEVITSVGVFSQEKEIIFSDIAEVTFGPLTDEEIDYYITKYKPFDKAGSYGVQEWIGYMGVCEIKGSYFTVMGLPVYQLYKVLMKF